MYSNSQERERDHYGYEVIESLPTPKQPTQIELRPVEDPFSPESQHSPSYGDNHELRKGPASTPKRLLNRLRGWRLGAFLSAVTALLTLVVNAGVVIWLLGKGAGEVLIPLYRGSCSRVAKIDIVVHLAINILSTILLGGSNYCVSWTPQGAHAWSSSRLAKYLPGAAQSAQAAPALLLETLLICFQMQVLVAPTRAEIGRAHARGKYMDIAVPSIRNLRLISRYKVCLWLTLALTSLPLHLM
jgi:hypothetical protein